MKKIEDHYAWLGLELLFKRLPALEHWLKEKYDDAFVTEVCLYHTPTVPSMP